MNKDIFFRVSFAVGFVAVIIGAWLKIMHSENADIVLTIGIIATIIYTIIALYEIHSSKKWEAIIIIRLHWYLEGNYIFISQMCPREAVETKDLENDKVYSYKLRRANDYYDIVINSGIMWFYDVSGQSYQRSKSFTNLRFSLFLKLKLAAISYVPAVLGLVLFKLNS